VELFLEALVHAVDGEFDVWLDVARKRRQELLLDRARLRPILETDQAGLGIDQLLAGTIDERDRPRLDLLDREPGRRGRLLDPELLRPDRRHCNR